eukprot:CAMPEP_0119545086 /NCGR_PEP_ID=MMETSP1344-20130328/55062_1 /TAXON_ID=236787 /ORGANISM="Florenciella parvula, Strain CCMP2471" /LENGTH=279 /DNA_ID=CAMNT_0007589599 /DNA_START=61 /DNA_END=899 /DNA_ORIENTATION=+
MADEEKPKPSADEKGETITIRVRDQTGEETFFKVKKSTRFEKVFSTYAQRKGVNVASLRFLIDGERINPSQSPAELDMEDQDQIDCMLEQQAAAEHPADPSRVTARGAGWSGVASRRQLRVPARSIAPPCSSAREMNNGREGAVRQFAAARTAGGCSPAAGPAPGSALNVASLRFLIDGERINPSQSPAELDMEDQVRQGAAKACMLQAAQAYPKQHHDISQAASPPLYSPPLPSPRRPSLQMASYPTRRRTKSTACWSNRAAAEHPADPSRVTARGAG